jgi:hypothetical protein
MTPEGWSFRDNLILHDGVVVAATDPSAYTEGPYTLAERIATLLHAADTFHDEAVAGSQSQPNGDLREQIAALLQARLPWPTADACATDIVQMFDRKGWAVR